MTPRLFDPAVKVGLVSQELAEVLAPSAGMRNALVHDYLDIDWDQVARAVPLALRDYAEYIRQVAAFLRRQEGQR